MKKRIIAVFMALLLVLSFASCKEADSKIKNVILLIPDGGGYANFDLANDVKEAGGFTNPDFKNKTATDKGPMFMKDYLAGSATTLSAYENITDSAAAGTAIATGHKTFNGYVGVDENMMPLATILEASQYAGKATGIISTYEWMHATPASFTSHAEDRGDYGTIYRQIQNQRLDVVLGSGYGAVAEYDGSIDAAKERGYTVIEHKDQLLDVKPGDKLWGNMSNPSSPLDIHLEDGQATLAEMTQAAITALSADEDGFFLMVEGSKVDAGGHANDAVTTTSEYLAFDAAFRVAVEFAKSRDDTVVIAIPDHDTGAMLYDEIPDKALAVQQIQAGENPSNVSWGTTGHSDRTVGVWMYVPEGVEGIKGLNKTLGDSQSQRADYIIDNTDIAPYIASLFGVDLEKITQELFVDVSELGEYDWLDGVFTFYDGNCWVKANESVYYQDDKEVDMNGQVAVYLGGCFYMPKSAVDDIGT